MSAEESLRDQAYAAIRDRIVSGALPGGEPLSDSRLATLVGVSRTPVRAALEALEADGLVRRHRSGYVVAVVTPRTIHDVFAVRIALECYALRTLDPEDPQSRWDKFDYIFRKFQTFADLPIGDDWLVVQEADVLFHREIVLRTSNEVALEIADRVERRIYRLRALACRSLQQVSFGARDHLVIVRAILDRDFEHAAELLNRHLIAGRDLLVSLMSQPEGPVAASPATGSGPLAKWLEGNGPFPALQSLPAKTQRAAATKRRSKTATRKIRREAPTS